MAYESSDQASTDAWGNLRAAVCDKITHAKRLPRVCVTLTRKTASNCPGKGQGARVPFLFLTRKYESCFRC